MTDLLYQDELLQIILSYSLDTFPHSVLLLGPQGCGKHTLLNIIQSKLNINVENITNHLTYDYLLDLTIRTSPYLYIIEASQLTIRQQNIILKFLEESTSNSFVVVISNHDNLLDTIVNRCQVFRFKKYTTEMLSTFLVPGMPAEILQYCDTPAEVINFNYEKFESMLKLINKLIDEIAHVSIHSLLQLVDFINFSERNDENDGFTLAQFIKVLRKLLLDKYILTKDEIFSKMFMTLENSSNDLLLPNIDSKRIFEHFLLDLKLCV